MRPAILAVDSGASKIDVALISRAGDLVGAARHAAFANFGLDHQNEPPLDALDEAIRRACLDGGLDPEARPVADVGVLCLAGADLPLDDRRIGRQVTGRGWARPAHQVAGVVRGPAIRAGPLIYHAVGAPKHISRGIE